MMNPEVQEISGFLFNGSNCLNLSLIFRPLVGAEGI